MNRRRMLLDVYCTLNCNKQYFMHLFIYLVHNSPTLHLLHHFHLALILHSSSRISTIREYQDLWWFIFLQPFVVLFFSSASFYIVKNSVLFVSRVAYTPPPPPIHQPFIVQFSHWQYTSSYDPNLHQSLCSLVSFLILYLQT